jgi:hypothetical protein
MSFFHPTRGIKKGIQMATSSIHIATGGNGYFAHNSRESKTVNAIFDDEQNFCSCTNAEAFDLFKKELTIRTEAYQTRTGQKLQSKTATHLSAIVNFNKEHTPEDIKKLCDYLEKELDTKVLQFAMHRDEGHIAENGEKIKNYHAHIEFIGLDSLGNSIKRKLGKKELINLQTKTAEILNMQRGRNYVKEKAKRPKRLDTYEFKKAKENESKLILATKKDLQDANNQLRTFMKENGALRTDYAELEKLKKELEEKLKAKDLTIEEMESKFKELESLVFSKKVYKETKEKVPFKEVAEHYESKNKEVNAKIEEVAEVLQSPKDLTFFEWIKNKFQELKEKIFKLENENEKLKNENLNLKERVNSLIDEKCELLKELGEPTKVKNDFKEEIHQKGLNLLSSLSVEEKIATFKDREVDYKKVQEKIKEQREELQRVQQRKM